MRTGYLALFVAAAPACSGGSSGAPSPEQTGAATFTEVYKDIISVVCIDCHKPGQVGVSEGMLDMSTQEKAYANLVGVEAAGTSCANKGKLVASGDANKSIFYLKVSLDQTPCGERMPFGGAPLTSSQAAEIESWINAGAMSN